MKIVVIASHPDDEVLGCGGTIAQLADEGHRVGILIVGEGITSRFTDRASADRELLDLHHSRAIRAGQHLGAESVEFLNLPDQRLDELPLLEVTHAIEGFLQRAAPDVVYVQHGGDLNNDHSVTFRAALTALRPMPGRTVRALYAFPVASSTEWSFGLFEPAFRPTVFVDIERTLARKIEAMEIYESETRPFPHPRSPSSLEAAARTWGSQVGLKAAEPFQLIWEIRSPAALCK